jgi:hypothetical protein
MLYVTTMVLTMLTMNYKAIAERCKARVSYTQRPSNGGTSQYRTPSQRRRAANKLVSKMVRKVGQAPADFARLREETWRREYNRTAAPNTKRVKAKCAAPSIAQRWDTPEHKEWSSAVKWRCGHKCVACGSRNGLRAHHIDGWDKHEDKRFDVDNGAALCQECHDKFHAAYGRGGNTREQFTEWMLIVNGKTV